MRLTLLALTYFQKTAEMQHLTHAAQALHISQPSLSHTIKMLELELGVPLFRRAGRNIVLTKYGEILLSHTNRIMRELKSAQKELEDAKEAQDMTVTISIFAASMIIPAFLTEFKKEYPQIRFEIIQQRDQADRRHHGHVDLYLSSSINPIDNDHSATLLREDIMLAMPDAHPLADKKSVNLEDFEKSDFISLQQGAVLRSITDFYCQMAGFTPHVILESDNPGTVREFIKAGLGVSFAPSITWHGVGGDKVSLVPIASPTCQRYIGLTWEKGHTLSAPAESVKQYFIKNFAGFAKKFAAGKK